MFDVRNLSAAYGQSQVLHGIDLSVERGEIVVLVGRNGMGKSTLMKSLIGVMPARSGQIVVDGADVTKLPSHQRVARGLAYVPQGRQIFGTMTARLLRDIRSIRNICIVVCEQLLSFVLDIADRILVMEGGRIVHTDTREHADEAAIARFLAV
jgi:ABC-type branched-subunit amino acid transport system ATPase component